MTPVHYYVGHKLLGVGQSKPHWIREQRIEASQWSYALFCPLCGEIWARVQFVGASDWYPLRVACERHGDGVIDSGWIADEAEPPIAVLLHDFLIESKEFDKPTTSDYTHQLTQQTGAH